MGLDFIELMQKKRTLYLLHPNDAVAIASQVLNITDRRQFANKVLDALGAKRQDSDNDRGWKACDRLSGKCCITIYWGQIPRLVRKRAES